MLTSTRLPSGGTSFAISPPSLARIVDTWLVRMSPGLGTSTIMYAIANLTIGSQIIAATAITSPRRTHFQLICGGDAGCLPGGRDGGPPSPGGRRGGTGGGGGCFGGGGPSSAALTTSMGSRHCGGASSRTAGRIVVCRSSGGRLRARGGGGA